MACVYELMIQNHKQTTNQLVCSSVMQWRNLILPPDVHWVKTICVEADAPKFKSGLESFSEVEIGSQATTRWQPVGSPQFRPFPLPNDR